MAITSALSLFDAHMKILGRRFRTSPFFSDLSGEQAYLHTQLSAQHDNKKTVGTFQMLNANSQNSINELRKNLKPVHVNVFPVIVPKYLAFVILIALSLLPLLNISLKKKKSKKLSIFISLLVTSWKCGNNFP